MPDTNEFLEDWSFNWGAMDVLIGGKSAIDLAELGVKDFEDATEFLRYYGYDPEKTHEAKHIHAVIVESWHFISHYLMPDEWARGLRPPDDLLYADDARPILMASSDLSPENRLRQVWCCSLLRVMHTIAHIEGVTRLIDVDIAREQIMSRFREHIFYDERGTLRLGIPQQSIPLVSVEWKNSKSRDSIILKLLHKKGNVAENIYDFLGVRFVTFKLLDVMRVAKFLRDFHMVSFPNCNPSRARNSLIDVEEFRRQLKLAAKALSTGRINQAQFLEQVDAASQYLDKPSDGDDIVNPHSGRDYRAVQLTGRQLIRVPSPFSEWRRKCEALQGFEDLNDTQRRVLDDILFMAKSWQLDEEANEYVGFFPFEVHILDEEAAERNKEGNASHDRYKRSQVRAARRRVLSRVLALLGPESPTPRLRKKKGAP